MGWLWTSAPSGPERAKPSPDGGFIAPDRDARARCWEARDRYYACLDGAGIVDPIARARESREACGREEEGFDKDCARSWVTYFKQKRLADWKKEQIIKEIEDKGGEVLPRPQGPAR